MTENTLDLGMITTTSIAESDFSQDGITFKSKKRLTAKTSQRSIDLGFSKRYDREMKILGKFETGIKFLKAKRFLKGRKYYECTCTFQNHRADSFLKHIELSHNIQYLTFKKLAWLAVKKSWVVSEKVYECFICKHTFGDMHDTIIHYLQHLYDDQKLPYTPIIENTHKVQSFVES